ncbi:MAG TPA: VOC family protein [Solirubrobacteraceae bacterium]|nr:VOC family protein [Solirubrobacteraceae bacterium]
MGVIGVNHLALRTPDATALRRFYLDLTGAEPLDGDHEPIRLGQTLIVFFPSEDAGAAPDADEIAFDVDGAGFDDVLGRANGLGCDVRGPVAHNACSTSFYLRDPDGRRLEFILADPGVYWR